MKIPYRITEYKEANVDIEGIVDDLKYNGISKDSITEHIFMNDYYYLDNYSNMEPGGEVQDSILEDLVNEVSKHFGA